MQFNYDYGQDPFNQSGQSFIPYNTGMYDSQPSYNKSKFTNKRGMGKRPANEHNEWPAKKRFAAPARGAAPQKQFASTPHSNQQDNSHAVKPHKSNETDLILRADEPANVKVVGRLELALGNILKEMRLTYSKPPHCVSFGCNDTLKPIKLKLRERIRDVMMGKSVQNLKDIITTYRAAYPADTDGDLIKLAQTSKLITDEASVQALKQKRIKPDNSGRFVTYNMNCSLVLIHTLVLRMYDWIEDFN